jgi:hypothetical protein
MRDRVRTGFTGLKDIELDEDAASAVKGLTGNAGIVFTGSAFTDFVAAVDIYHASMGALKTAGNNAFAVKDVARKALLPLFSAVAVVVNQQAEGNLLVLQSTGIRLVAHRGHRRHGLPVNFQVKYGPNSNMLVSVKRSPAGGRGTVFAFTPATNPDTHPATWQQKAVNGCKATISGLTAGMAYLFSVAYKGRDKDALVWGPPVNKIVGN